MNVILRGYETYSVANKIFKKGEPKMVDDDQLRAYLLGLKLEDGTKVFETEKVVSVVAAKSTTPPPKTPPGGTKVFLGGKGAKPVSGASATPPAPPAAPKPAAQEGGEGGDVAEV
jgi:hypothetical protein